MNNKSYIDCFSILRILHPLPKVIPGIVWIPGNFFILMQETAVKSCGRHSPACAIPLRLPLSGSKGVYICLHPGGALLPHLLGDMPIDIQSKRGGGVAEIVLNGFQIVPILEGQHRKSVPKLVEAENEKRSRI